MKKKLLVFTAALAMFTMTLPMNLAFAETSLPLARNAAERNSVETKVLEGTVGNVLSYTASEKGSIFVKANASNKELVRAMAVSYEDGRMVEMNVATLTAGSEGSLILQDWGESVKLFAVSKDYTPVCKEAEVWNADETVKTVADLKSAIEAAKENDSLLIDIDKEAVLADSLNATFLGKDLIINFNDVDMNGKNLTINAPNAEKIELNDNTAGTGGTEVGVLTINAPNADVISTLVADSIDIIAVKYGTFHAKDKVNNGIEIKKGAVEVDKAIAETTKVTVPDTATDEVKIKGAVDEVIIETTQEVVLDANVNVVEVSADGAKVSGTGEIEKIKANENVTISAANVTEVEVGSGVTAELKADVEKVIVPATVTKAPTIKVEEGVKVDTVTTEADVNVTGSGTIGNMDVSGSGDITITAPEDSAIKVESIVNTGGGNIEIKDESNNQAELPETFAKIVADTVDDIEIDLSTSDEWRTEGYLYQLFDINFNAAEWAVTEEDFDWSEVTYWVDGEQFIWDVETSKPGDYAVETDLMGYYYNEDTERGYAQGLIAAYEENVKAGETYKVEIRFPSSYLCVTDKDYEIRDGETFTVDFNVNITDSKETLEPAKDTLDTIVINAGTAEDWITEGYVYVEQEILFDGAEWSMEPSWGEHVTYWIDGEQFIWDPENDEPGDYDIELDMMAEYDEDGNLRMKAMVFAYMENVANGDSFDMEIRIPTYSLARTGDAHRITRNETAVIDFKVVIKGCEDYVPPVVDRVEDIYIDLSASDEWRTEGYLYELFDINFNAAEWAVADKDFDWGEVTYWVDGEPFVWDVETSNPGDFAVEVDLFDYFSNTDEKTGVVTGTATGLIAAFVDNVEADSYYDVAIQFPSDYLRITDERYQIKSGDTFTVDFGVYIADSEEELTPAKDTLNTIPIYVTAADETGNIYAEEEITFNGAAWRMEPYWEGHVTYEVSNDAVSVEMVPRYDAETGELFMDAKVAVDANDVAVGDIISVEIYVPTYSLVRTDDAYRITRDETAVIDFNVLISEGEGYIAPVADTVDDINIDLSTSDEWRTEGYLYQLFDIEFNAAEWAVTEEDFDWSEVTYWVDGKQFIWDVETSKPGDYAVEADLMGYYYDEDTETGYAQGLIAAYVDNVEEGETYDVEIQFPSDYLRVTDEYYEIKSGETFTVDFNVNITDSKETLTPAKDMLEEITVDLADTDLLGYAYAGEEVTFEGAKWIMEPYWEGHVTYWIDGEQFIYDWENVQPGDYALEVDLIPDYDDEGNMLMYATVYAYADKVKAGDSFDVEIKVPTYSMERTDDGYRITRNETAVIDYTVIITGTAPDYGDIFSAEVTGVNIDCYDNGEVVEEGTVIVKFAHENYTEPVEFALMDHDNNEYVAVTAFFTEEDDYPKGSVTFEMAGVPVANYEVVYRVGNTWVGTGEYINLWGNDFFAEATGIYIDCRDDGEFVTEGTVTVTFAHENYTEPVEFGLMDHDNNEYVAVTTVFTEEDDDSEGSVTFDMTGVPVANYEVVYLVGDTWVGTYHYIDLTGTEEPEVTSSITLTQNGNQVFASWDNYGCENYTWTFEDSTGDVKELQWTKKGECESYDLVPLLPEIETGTAAYDFVVYEMDKTDDDWIGRELDRLEDAITVTAAEDPVLYIMDFTDPENGVYSVSFSISRPTAGTVFKSLWTREGQGRYASQYVSDGSQTYRETALMGALKDGDVYDLRQVDFAVENNKLNVTMTPSSEVTYRYTETPDIENVNFTLSCVDGEYYATWNEMGYNEYQVRVYDGNVMKTSMWIYSGTTSYNLLRFIPCADENTSYDIVLLGGADRVELARLEDAIVVTVDGSAEEYTAEFSETGVVATWETRPTGLTHIFELTAGDSDNIIRSGGGGIYGSQTLDETLYGGEVYDMRVVKEASLNGQVLSATITPASEAIYVIEDEPATEEMSVTVTLNKDTVVVNPEKGPYVEFSFENLTEATTISTYVVKTKGASEAEAIEVKTQDITAGIQYATIGLYSSTFNEAGTYYVYYKTGNEDWCDTPLKITVTEPEEPKAELYAGYTKCFAGEALEKDVKIELKNDTFAVDMAAGTDVTEWFEGMPEDWTATVYKDVASGGNIMVIIIACEADKTVVGSGFIGVTIPADVLAGGNDLTPVQTIAYAVKDTTEA